MWKIVYYKHISITSIYKSSKFQRIRTFGKTMGLSLPNVENRGTRGNESSKIFLSSCIFSVVFLLTLIQYAHKQRKQPADWGLRQISSKLFSTTGPLWLHYWKGADAWQLTYGIAFTFMRWMHSSIATNTLDFNEAVGVCSAASFLAVRTAYMLAKPVAVGCGLGGKERLVISYERGYFM